jgi:TonB-linked SusC/RagA family outer membrane protein
MLEKIKLTFLMSLFFAGALNVPLYAQTVQDSTETAVPMMTPIKDNKIKKGVLVKGVVKSAKTKTGLSGINVGVKDFSAAITNDDGTFEINVPTLDAVLTLTGPELQAKFYPLKKRNLGIEIFLYEEDYSPFFQTANLPYGSKLQYSSTDATSIVNLKKDQWSSPIKESIGDFIQGKAAGLSSVRKSGVPGAGAYLTLRGFNSLYATNKPLIIVDGMIYEDEDYGSGIIKNNSSSPLENIDVKDIENITVLKDNTTMYGTKGANGVLIINTTRPVDLSTKIDFTMYGSYNQEPEKLTLMKSNAYRTHLSQLEMTRGLSQDQIANLPYMNDNPQAPGYYKYHNDTNWQDQVFESSISQNYFLKVRGGDNIAKYGLSVGYLKNEGIVSGTESSRYSTRLNAALRLTKKLYVDANMSFINNISQQRDQAFAMKTSPIYLALTKAPFFSTNEIDNNGQQSPNLADVDDFDVTNPNAILANSIGTNKNYRFFGNLNFKYNISDSWDVHSLFGLTFNKERENFFIPDMGVSDIILPTAIAKNRSGSDVQQLNSFYTDTYANYNTTFLKNHHVDVRFGFRTQSNKSENDFGLGFNSPTDDFVSVGSGAILLRQAGGSLGEWNWLNTYANADYNFNSKYFLTASYALDGSSRFGDENGSGSEKFALMTSLTGAWVISSENFMKNLKDIDFLKIRATVGTSGNDDIGNFTAQQYYISQNILGMQGLVRGNIANPDLKWETVQKFNFGADIGLFNERLNLSINYFTNKTKDMLIYESISIENGFDFVASNSGSMRTFGTEFSLNSRILNTKDISFDLGLNLASYSNEVLSLPNGRILTQFGNATYITEIGNDANLFYGLKTNGVYSSTTEAKSDGLSRRLGNGELTAFAGGDIRFSDTNNDKIIDDKDRMVIGNPNPDFTGSITANLTYKRFSLQGLFAFSVGNELYNGVRYNLEKMSGYENQSVTVENRWRAEGQQTNMPKAVWGDPMGNAEFSDRWIEDGSYLRLKTLVLGYDFNVEKMKYIKAIKIYATANNLFTLTDYSGYDPEFSATSSIFGQGADVGLTPQFKSFQLGLRLGL